MRYSISFLVPARKNSKRIKNKNFLKIKKLNLIENKIKILKQVGYGEIYISSDSIKAKKIAMKFGVNFVNREKIYSKSNSTMISCVLHFLRYLKKTKKKLPDYVVLSPPTYPFISIKSFKESINKIIKLKKFNSLCSITHSSSHPLDFVRIKGNKLFFDEVIFKKRSMTNYERTQDRPVLFEQSGAIRICKTNYLLKFIDNKNYNYKKYFQDLSKCTYQFISNKEAFDINIKDDIKKLRELSLR